MAFIPLKDRVLIERLDKESITAGGIVLPESAKDKPSRGEVLAVGPGAMHDGKVQPVGVVVGQKVIFGQYSGTEIKIDGQNLIVMREDDIMGIVEE